MRPPTALLVIAKAPVPGRVKTRLCPPYTHAEAAALAAAALADTLDLALALPVRRRILVLDGDPGPWLPRGVEVVPQCEGGLDERLAHAFTLDKGPSLLIGMDTPQAAYADLAPALGEEAWWDTDAYLGTAADGGFWALGLARPDPELLRGVPMSTETTGREQRRRIAESGLSIRELPVLRDVDTAADVAEVAGLAPRSRFARTAVRLGVRR